MMSPNVSAGFSTCATVKRDSHKLPILRDAKPRLAAAGFQRKQLSIVAAANCRAHSRERRKGAERPPRTVCCGNDGWESNENARASSAWKERVFS